MLHVASGTWAGQKRATWGGRGGKGIRYVSSRILIPGRSEGLDMIDVVSIGVESIPFVKIGI